MFEEIEVKKHHSVLFTILGVFVLLAAITGVAVAAWTWTYTSQNTNTIGTGNISMTFLESTDVINIEDALPTTDTTGKAYGEDKSFDFAVTTTASGAPGTINYQISLTKVEATSGYTRLDDNQVKVYLAALNDGNETQLVSPTLMNSIITSGDTGVIFNTTSNQTYAHKHTTVTDPITKKYRLKMWVDYNVDASEWKETTKLEYKVKVSVDGSLSA